MFVIIWRYSVAAGREDDFRSAYGPRGEWTSLFGLAGGYLGTKLVHCDEPGFYITVDRWQDEAHFEEFMAEADMEYQKLDVALSALTVSEELIGRGSIVG